MLCENCRENEVNFKYTEVINGNKREIALCDKCAKKLGLQSLDFEKSFAGVFEDVFDISSAKKLRNLFNMPYSTSLENLFELSLNDRIFTKFLKDRIQERSFFDEIDNIDNMNEIFDNKSLYNTFFEEKDSKLGNTEKNKINSNLTKQEKQDVLNDIEKVINKKQKSNEEINKKQKLQIELEKAIKEERYEDAAKIRDEIKNIPE